MFQKFLIGFILFLFTWHSAISQGGPPKPRNNYQLETRIHGAIFLQHHFEMTRFDSHFPAFELSLQRATYGRKKWEALYRYPMIGVSYWYAELGGFAALGQAHAVYPFINFPLNPDMNNSINFRLGAGLAYLTNKFHPTDNFQNFAIGSHINAAVSLFFDYRFQASKRLQLFFAAGLTHFSNGSMKTPNFGLNILSISGGLAYNLRKPNPYLDLKLLPELYKFEFDGKKWISVEAQVSIGFKDMTQETGKRHSISNLAINVMKPVSMRSKIGVGFDLTQDGSDKALLQRKGVIINKNSELLKPGANIAYEMLLDRTSFLFNVGIHLAGAERSEGDIYQKIAVKQLFTENLFGTIALTAHFGKADYIGFGLGYRFDFKYY